MSPPPPQTNCFARLGFFFSRVHKQNIKIKISIETLGSTLNISLKFNKENFPNWQIPIYLLLLVEFKRIYSKQYITVSNPFKNVCVFQLPKKIAIGLKTSSEKNVINAFINSEMIIYLNLPNFIWNDIITFLHLKSQLTEKRDTPRKQPAHLKNTRKIVLHIRSRTLCIFLYKKY